MSPDSWPNLPIFMARHTWTKTTMPTEVGLKPFAACFRHHQLLINSISRRSITGSLSNTPVMVLVTMATPGLLTPRVVMH